MFNTYIYGTPLGFDFYEDIASLKDYFKGFYVSSRKGSRLMVNRRENGETFYNYLVYGLAESGGRPNSFFGMSISMDSYEYVSDFKDILEYFDSLFETLVQRGALFIVNRGNVTQYKVAKFRDASEEILWIKNKILILFDKNLTGNLSGSIRKYDSSFIPSTSGQIRCFNPETNPTKILDTFKRNNWIALSSIFKPEEETVEIALLDIEKQINVYTKDLLDIAISPSPIHKSKLEEVELNCKKTIELVGKYLYNVTNNLNNTVLNDAERGGLEKESVDCESLINKANEIVRKARKIANGIKDSGFSIDSSHSCVTIGSNSKPKQPITVASGIQQSDNDIQGGQPAQNHKVCKMCGKAKGTDDFNTGCEVCRDCESKQKKGFLFHLDITGVAIISIIAIMVGVTLFLLKGSGTEGNDVPSENVGAYVAGNPVDNNVNAERFNSYLQNSEFFSAYSELRNKIDSNNYLSPLKSSMETYLWNQIIAYEEGSKIMIRSFFKKNDSIVGRLNLQKDSWLGYVDSYVDLKILLGKSSLNNQQKNRANILIESLPNISNSRDLFRNHLSQILENTERQSSMLESPSVTITTPNGDIETVENKKTYEFRNGTEITIKSNKYLSFKGGGESNGGTSSDPAHKMITIKVSNVTNLEFTAQNFKFFIKVQTFPHSD